MNKSLRRTFRHFFEKTKGHHFKYEPFPHQLDLLVRPGVIESLPWFTATDTGHTLYPWEYSATWLDLPRLEGRLTESFRKEITDIWRWLITQLRIGELSIIDLRTLGFSPRFPKLRAETNNNSLSHDVERALSCGKSSILKEPSARPELDPIHTEIVMDGWRFKLSPDVLSIHSVEADIPVHIPHGIWRLPEEYWRDVFNASIELGAESPILGYEAESIPTLRALMFRIWFMMHVTFTPGLVTDGGRNALRPLGEVLFGITRAQTLQYVQGTTAFHTPWADVPYHESIEEYWVGASRHSLLAPVRALSLFTRKFNGGEACSELYRSAYYRMEPYSQQQAPELLRSHDPNWWANGEVARFRDRDYYRALIS